MAIIDRINKMAPVNGTDPRLLTGYNADTAAVNRQTKPTEELGSTGLLRTKGVGYVYEEWLKELSSFQQKRVYREMRDNDPVIGAMFFAIETILRKAEWTVEAAKGADANNIADFVQDCLDDMSHTWEDFIAECVSEFTFGFSLFETVYKKRSGLKDKGTSRFDDGLIGWRKFAPRAQESILYWIWDDEGGLQGAVQLAPPDYHSIILPIQKCLLFRTTSLKGNPEGRSMLRNCFRPWFYKRRIEEIEGIGIERDLCGLPVLYVTGEALDQIGGPDAARALVRDIRVDDQMGVVLPQAFDDKGNPLVKLELLKSGGAKQTDPDAAIKRYNSDMLNTILAGFIQFGQTPTGSRALHLSATQIFAMALGTFMDSIAAVMNRYAIPRLLRLNNMDLEKAPKLVPGEIGVRDLEELSDYVSKLSTAGITFFDVPTSDFLRKAARMPKTPEDSSDFPKYADPTQPPPPVPGAEPAPGKPGGAPQKTPRENPNQQQQKPPQSKQPNGKPGGESDSGLTDVA